MSDEQLIQLLREKPPEEFSSDDIALVRRRLPHSSELRQAVADQLELDQTLYHTLGGVRLSVDELVRRASLVPPSQGAGKLFGWPTAAAVLLTLLAFGAVIHSRGNWRPAQVARAEKVAGELRINERDPTSAPKRGGPVRHTVRKPPVGSAMPLSSPSDSPSREAVGDEPAPAAALDASTSAGSSSISTATPKGSASEGVASGKPADAQVPAAEAWFTTRVEIDNEARRASAELASAIEHRAWRDACQVIVATAAEHGDGLTLDTQNGRLRSFGLMVSEAMRRHAALRQAMRDDYDDDAWRAFRRAADRGDPGAVATIAEQFLGTAAAAAARQWLGDRALSAGRFQLALGHYRAAAELASDQQRGSLSARVRLSGALLGLELEQPVTETIDLAGQQLSPLDFEQLVAEMRSRATAASVAGELAFTITDEQGHGAAARKRSTGEIAWRQRLGGISLADPATVDDRLFVCLAVPEAGGGTWVHLIALAARTGEVVERRPLARLPTDESGGPSRDRRAAQIEVTESSLVVAVGDLLFHTDLEGRPRWVGHAAENRAASLRRP